jgi:phage terminase large subunit GpA-like protein
VFFVPMLKHLKWDKKAGPQAAHDSARLACPECGVLIENKDKGALNARGRYQWHTLAEDGSHAPTDDEPPSRTASFWVSGIMSPWQTFGDVAEIMVASYRSGEPERIQAAINTYAGELFASRGEAPKWEEVAALRAPYRSRTIPDGVQIITMGADVQKLGIYYVVRGWGFNSESWLLDSGYIPGETEFDNVWTLLSRMIGINYLPDARAIDRVFIDSGYRPGDKLRRPEHQVYKFSRQFPGVVYPTKGHDTLDRTYKMSRVDMSVGGRVIKGGVQLWHLNSDALKSWIHSRIRWPVGEIGGFHLNQDTDEDYCRQIVAEEVVTKPSGKRVWVLRSRDNHYLDCEVGALAAAMSLQVQTLKPIEQAAKLKPAPKVKKSPFISTDEGPFIKR